MANGVSNNDVGSLECHPYGKAKSRIARHKGLAAAISASKYLSLLICTIVKFNEEMGKCGREESNLIFHSTIYM